jgi:hypothetical protein
MTVVPEIAATDWKRSPLGCWNALSTTEDLNELGNNEYQRRGREPDRLPVLSAGFRDLGRLAAWTDRDAA